LEFQGIPRNLLESQEFQWIPRNSNWNNLIPALTRKTCIFGISFQFHSNPIPIIPSFPSFQLESLEFQGKFPIGILRNSKDSNWKLGIIELNI
jgi:hypothetical protein